MYDEEIINSAQKLKELLLKNSLKIAIVESCTGGMISSVITTIPGASGVFELGIVTYSIESKVNLLKIDKNVIEKYTVVSAEAALNMALGVLQISNADIAIATTGEAGPVTQSRNNVGLVFIAYINKSGIQKVKKLNLKNLDRQSIIRNVTFQAINFAIQNICN